MSKVILYIATSEDGFIADQYGQVDWLPQPTGKEDFGYNDFYKDIHSIVMGSKTYEQILGWGHWLYTGKPAYVFTSRKIEVGTPNTKVLNDNVKDFAEQQQAKYPGKNIWLLGGAELVKSFSNDELIDECIITVIPITLGKGIPLGLDFSKFKLAATHQFARGVEQRIYLKD